MERLFKDSKTTLVQGVWYDPGDGVQAYHPEHLSGSCCSLPDTDLQGSNRVQAGTL